MNRYDLLPSHGPLSKVYLDLQQHSHANERLFTQFECDEPIIAGRYFSAFFAKAHPAFFVIVPSMLTLLPRLPFMPRSQTAPLPTQQFCKLVEAQAL